MSKAQNDLIPKSVFSIETGVRTFIMTHRILRPSTGMGCERAGQPTLEGCEIDGRRDRLRRPADPGFGGPPGGPKAARDVCRVDWQPGPAPPRAWSSRQIDRRSYG